MYNKMSLCLKTKCFKSNIIGSLCRFVTSSTEIIEQNEQVLIDDSDEAGVRELEIEKKRNISRLSAAHFNLINGKKPYEIPKTIAHLTVKYNRKMYGKYGSSSGVNPSLCWPSKQDIQEKLEFESVAFPYSIKMIMESAAQKRKEQELQILLRDKEVAAKFEKLEQWKKDFSDKIAKKTTEAKLAKEKKERLVEEVRRHFGFTMDPRDERFQEMLAKREKEQKKLEKQAKREAKEKIMIAKLQQQNVELSESKK